MDDKGGKVNKEEDHIILDVTSCYRQLNCVPTLKNSDVGIQIQNMTTLRDMDFKT